MRRNASQRDDRTSGQGDDTPQKGGPDSFNQPTGCANLPVHQVRELGCPCTNVERATLIKLLPNQRLKLAGGDRFKGSGVLCPWRGTACGRHACAGGWVARSLSAIG